MKKDTEYLKDWDVFVSYASEDADTIARPIAEGLRHHGLRVWFDKFELRVGDSLTKSINRGLARSSYGVVVLSPSFLAKKWPQKELAALISLEEAERHRILPVWHQLTHEELKETLPMLADVVAVQTSQGVPNVVRELLKAVNIPFVGESLAGLWNGQTGRLRLFEEEGGIQGDYDWLGHEWAGHIEAELDSRRGGPYDRPFVILKFRWWWDLSHEKGNGFFVAPSGGILIDHCYARDNFVEHARTNFTLLSGTWAFDYEKLNLRRRLDKLPHPWAFRRGMSEAQMYSETTQLADIRYRYSERRSGGAKKPLNN